MQLLYNTSSSTRRCPKNEKKPNIKNTIWEKRVYVTRGALKGSLKNFSPFGPAVLDSYKIYIYVHT